MSYEQPQVSTLSDLIVGDIFSLAYIDREGEAFFNENEVLYRFREDGLCELLSRDGSVSFIGGRRSFITLKPETLIYIR